MDKLETIKYAKSYLEKMANGVDPVSGGALDGGALAQERLRKCFAFVAGILDEAVRNHGLITLPENDPASDAAEYKLVRAKAPFSLDEEQKSRVAVSEAPILPSAFVKNVNAAVDLDRTEKLTLTAVNKWLMKNGYITESHVRMLVGRNVKTLTPRSFEIGISEKTVPDGDTGMMKTQLYFTKKTQKFLLDNIDAIADASKRSGS